MEQKESSVSLERLRKDVDWVMSKVRNFTVASIKGLSSGPETRAPRFLREDGQFADAGLTQAQVLTRVSLRC